MAHTTLLTVICEAALENKLVADLEQLGAPGWTLSDVRGRGSHGLRRADWDTAGNIRAEILCARELAERIARHLQERYYAHFAMVCYLAEVEVLRAEKFAAKPAG
ncbi:Membrane-associated protein [compost metagenome]